MATKFKHTTALKVVYNNVNARTLAALAQDKEDNEEVKKARKQLAAALVKQYNGNKDRAVVIGTTLRAIAHVVAAQKKIDETALIKELLPNDKVTALIDTPDRLATYIMTATNKRIDAQSTKTTKTTLPVAAIKKMFAIVGDIAKVATFFELTPEDIEKVVK